MQTYQVSPIPFQALPVVWGQVKALLKGTPDTWEEFETLESIHRGVETGRYILWTTQQETKVVFALLLQVRDYEEARVVQVVWGAGKGIQEFGPLLLNELEQFAQAIGAVQLQVIGRDGWERALAPFGYGRKYVVLAKRIPRAAARMH